MSKQEETGALEAMSISRNTQQFLLISPIRHALPISIYDFQVSEIIIKVKTRINLIK